MRKPSRRPGPRYALPLVRMALSKLALKTTSSPIASPIPRAMRCTCSSLSITHGPAISTRRREKSANSIGTGEQRLLDSRQTALSMLGGGADERLKQRVRLHRFALEFGVELAAQEPRMVSELTDLHVGVVRR